MNETDKLLSLLETMILNHELRHAKRTADATVRVADALERIADKLDLLGDCVEADANVEGQSALCMRDVGRAAVYAEHLGKKIRK